MESDVDDSGSSSTDSMRRRFGFFEFGDCLDFLDLDRRRRFGMICDEKQEVVRGWKEAEHILYPEAI